MLNDVLATIDGRQHQAVAMLKEFLSIPSISAQPDHAADMHRCAVWLEDQLRFAALDVNIMPTGGHPAVVARNKPVAGAPTVLVYGHYDVQPPEPLELWTTPPFEPAVRKDENGFDAIYARGAVDDKGQVQCHLEAIMAWQAHGGLPVNLILLIEGEEEIGSKHLADFIKQHAAGLRADICVVSDTGQFARGVPAITYGLRGLVYEEVFLTGPSHDLHSGIYGGAVPNPANVLCQLLATLHEPATGRVNIPGFYEDVIDLTVSERAAWKSLPFDEQAFFDSVHVPSGAGEANFSTLERKWARPTLDVNGLTAGYQGVGAKTVIGSAASGKVSMRLVPNQDPNKIRDAFERTLRDRCPKNVKIEFANHGAAPAVLVPREGDAMRAATQAVEVGFGKPPTLIREGGSIPVVGLFKQLLNVDTLLVGFGLPDDRVHSPNEKFDLHALHAGSRTAAALYAKIAAQHLA